MQSLDARDYEKPLALPGPLVGPPALLNPFAILISAKAVKAAKSLLKPDDKES